MVVYNDSRGISRASGSLNVLTDLRNVVIAVELRNSKNGQNYGMEESADACFFMKRVLGSAIVRMFVLKFYRKSQSFIQIDIFRH